MEDEKTVTDSVAEKRIEDMSPMDAFMAACLRDRMKPKPPQSTLESFQGTLVSGVKVGLWIGSVVLVVGVASAAVAWISPKKN